MCCIFATSFSRTLCTNKQFRHEFFSVVVRNSFSSQSFQFLRSKLQYTKMLSTKFDSKNKLWKGNEITPIYNAKVSLGQVILKVLEVNGPKFSQVLKQI